MQPNLGCRNRAQHLKASSSSFKHQTQPMKRERRLHSITLFSLTHPLPDATPAPFYSQDQGHGNS